MRLKHLLPLALFAVFTSAGSAFAAPPDTSNKAEMQQFFLNSCNKSKAECTCLADKLSNSFSSKEWIILMAALNDDPAPPPNTSEADLQQVFSKLTSAQTACTPR